MTEYLSPSSYGIQLSKFWILAGKSLPVNVIELALEVSAQKPDPITKIKGHSIIGIDGMLIQRSEKQCWYILYQENMESPGRINFTLAHEFGHYMMHRKSKDEFRCEQKKFLEYNEISSLSFEYEANRFASYLLMPIDDFRSQIDKEIATLDLLSHCADRYQVSFTAAVLKWLEFTEEAAMVVIARDGFVCWSYTSKSAYKLKVYLSPGSILPETSNERSLFPNNAINKGYKVPPGIWHPKLEAIESVILSDRFDLSIFLIQFPDANLIIHEEYEENDSFNVLSARASGLLWRK